MYYGSQSLSTRRFAAGRTRGLLPIEREAGLERVLSLHHRQVILDRPPRLFGAVVRSTTPSGKLREIHLPKVHVAIDDVRYADALRLPVAADVDRFRVFVERVEAECEVIHHSSVRQVPRR